MASDECAVYERYETPNKIEHESTYTHTHIDKHWFQNDRLVAFILLYFALDGKRAIIVNSLQRQLVMLLSLFVDCYMCMCGHFRLL